MSAEPSALADWDGPSSDEAESWPASIDLASLPQPIPILGPLQGYTQTNLQQQSQLRFQWYRRVLDRPLTEDEKGRVAYHTASGLAVWSYGRPLGILAGLWQTYRTRDSMRFPFLGAARTPHGIKLGEGVTQWPLNEQHIREVGQEQAEKEMKDFLNDKRHRGIKFDGETLHVWGREVGKGVSREVKVRGLHFLRGMAYIFCGLLISMPVISTWGVATLTMRESEDPQLANVVREVRQRRELGIKEERARGSARRERNLPGPRRDRSEAGADAASRGGEYQSAESGAIMRERRDPMGQGSRNAGERWRQHRQAIEKKRPAGIYGDADDDASPTGGAGMFDDFMPDDQQQQTAGTMSNGTSQTREPQQQQQRQQARQQQRQREQDRRRREGVESDQMQNDGLSAWDRVRQNSASASGPSSIRGDYTAHGQGRNTDSDYTMSAGEQEKGYAQGDAQRDFDARVERERRGQDFDR